MMGSSSLSGRPRFLTPLRYVSSPLLLLIVGKVKLQMCAVSFGVDLDLLSPKFGHRIFCDGSTGLMLVRFVMKVSCH